ncbi:MAG: SMI1/KNR4 family protein [Pseudomonadota bacterium]|nr:SMI1/KNR4 family protein [Pseudomonadota bacterium]
MNGNDIPGAVKSLLAEPTYARANPDSVGLILSDLGVEHGLLRSFLERYEGPFWSEYTGCEMLDLYEGEETIKSATETCRRQFGFPSNLLVLSRLTAGQVVVLDTSDDKVYEVDFEGGEELLNKKELEPRWGSLRSFLIEYFVGDV